MDYNFFIKKAKQFDSRNEFGHYEDVKNLPLELQDFYATANPLDVEMIFDGVNLKFYPAEELEDLCQEYQLPNECIIFATQNGDPIFLMNHKVYRTMPGHYKPEFICDSFDNFLRNL